ncbi:hypothetical protein C8A01DRAFT_39514 [Parachaetomium inaequale]|uniref:Uncharacterized protein n=1 Tax=Parachaetomium inaequale TaxID=2588326 RepID=A0AAN6SNV8_9PEZI|nr:hypothetical protein C8A01DRAFT_39514 [Parachaetomium inaequale]
MENKDRRKGRRTAGLAAALGVEDAFVRDEGLTWDDYNEFMNDTRGTNADTNSPEHGQGATQTAPPPRPAAFVGEQASDIQHLRPVASSDVEKQTLEGGHGMTYGDAQSRLRRQTGFDNLRMATSAHSNSELPTGTGLSSSRMEDDRRIDPDVPEQLQPSLGDAAPAEVRKKKIVVLKYRPSRWLKLQLERSISARPDGNRHKYKRPHAEITGNDVQHPTRKIRLRPHSADSVHRPHWHWKYLCQAALAVHETRGVPETAPVGQQTTNTEATRDASELQPGVQDQILEGASKMANIEGRISELRRDIDSTEQRGTEMAQDFFDDRQKLDALQAKFDRQEKQIARLKEKMAAEKKENAAKNAELEEKVYNLETALGIASSMANGAQETANTMRTELSALRTEPSPSYNARCKRWRTDSPLRVSGTATRLGVERVGPGKPERAEAEWKGGLGAEPLRSRGW